MAVLLFRFVILMAAVTSAEAAREAPCVATRACSSSLTERAAERAELRVWRWSWGGLPAKLVGLFKVIFIDADAVALGNGHGLKAVFGWRELVRLS